ncbi:ABC transporter substrate-binding protein [Marinomonas sp. 15G1-11]|uniref:ABC transporter substrate-binding protein n=1 Tax=Marinomonas phaeophyticola TaxID=3004091 RepID=A0ABT4JSD3_9GAMM|nr:ABC transporter substrate-binding protein [Marinomonas sp. 15G1-11]MCZ2721287.1 ABC transporter substrate-binding protein [Marinomonas sp. 15G1-11]
MKWQTPVCITFISALCFASIFAFALQATQAISAEPVTAVHFDNVPTRVVSIGGATTEILFALGVGDRVIGSDTTSYYPEQAQETAKVGYMRALSAEGVLSLEPEVVFAAEGAGPAKVLSQLQALSTPWVSLPEVTSLDLLYENIMTIGQVMSREESSLALVARLKKEQFQLEQAIKADNKKPRILFVMQHTGSPMVAGRNTAADRMIRLAGGDNVASAVQGYKPLTAEAMVNLNPQWILSTTLGADKVGGTEGMHGLPGFKFTAAAKANHIIVMDGLFLLGFGPRTLQAAQELRSFLHDK